MDLKSCIKNEGSSKWETHQWLKKAVLLSFRIKDNHVMERKLHKLL